MRLISYVALLAFMAVPASAQEPVGPADRLFHEQIMVLDTHLDTSALFERPGWRFDRLNNYDWDRSQIDLPRMEIGGLDGGFFVIYTPQGPLTPEGFAEARNDALMRAMAIQRVIAENGERIALATTAEDAERLHREGKRIAFQSIENSYPLGEDLSLLEAFYRMGVRMAGPVHGRNNQFADSATDEPRWNGLSPLGKKWVEEANRLGIIIDGSHASDAAFDQLLALSKAPIVLSHSGPEALFDHPRNIDDARLRRLSQAGGVMFLNSLYLSERVTSDERDAIEERQENWANLDAAERRKLLADKAALDARQAPSRTDFEMYMQSLLHAIRVMGVDHVGLGADWDGGGGVMGLWDISGLPMITARLRREGFSDSDIAKIWSGNLLRVMRQVQEAAENK